MKLKISLNKKNVLILLGVFFLLAGGLVYAYGTSSPATFGHSAGEVQISGTLQSTFVSKTFKSGSSGLSCPSGYQLTGCGCSDSTICYAYASNGKCYGSTKPTQKIYAICARIV